MSLRSGHRCLISVRYDNLSELADTKAAVHTGSAGSETIDRGRQLVATLV